MEDKNKLLVIASVEKMFLVLGKALTKPQVAAYAESLMSTGHGVPKLLEACTEISGVWEHGWYPKPKNVIDVIKVERVNNASGSCDLCDSTGWKFKKSKIEWESDYAFRCKCSFGDALSESIPRYFTF